MNYLWGGMILVGVGYDWKSWSSDRPGTCFGKGSGKPLPDNDRCHGILGRTYEDCGKRGDGKPRGICTETDTSFFVPVSSGKFHSSQIYGNEYGVQFSGAGLGGNPGRDFCHERVKAAAENVKSGDRRDV